jgi:uncharacterized oxidoreductase
MRDESSTVLASAAALERGVGRLLVACGVPDDQAAIVAEHLVDAESRGVVSHGLIRVAQYVPLVQQQKINLAARLTVRRQSAATAALDGGHGFGQVLALQAIDFACELARRTGIAAVTLANCSHTGRLGRYTEHAAERGLIGLMMVNTGGHGQCVAPYGGTSGRLATNPLSIAVPLDEAPLVLDFATGIVPEGKVRAFLAAGKSLPLGWVIDHRGRQTTNPADLYGPPRGAILPFGGHKGFALSLLIDVLAGALSGAGCCVDPTAPLAGDTDGVFMAAIDVAAFCAPAEFREVVKNLVRHVKSAPLADGVQEIVVPGEPEARTRAARLARGIPIEPGTWRLLAETAAGLGLDWRQVLGPTSNQRASP